MFYFIIGFILIITFILLGPYYLSIVFAISAQGEKLVCINFESLSRIYAIKCTKKERRNSLSIIILNRFLILKIERENKLKQLSYAKKELSRKGKQKKKKKTRFLIKYVIIHSPELLRRFLDVLKVRKVNIEGEFGLENPALTGVIYGLVQSLQFSQGKIFKFSLSPNFLENTFNGKAKFVVSFFFLKILLELSRAGAEVGWVYLRSKL